MSRLRPALQFTTLGALAILVIVPTVLALNERFSQAFHGVAAQGAVAPTPSIPWAEPTTLYPDPEPTDAPATAPTPMPTPTSSATTRPSPAQAPSTPAGTTPAPKPTLPPHLRKPKKEKCAPVDVECKVPQAIDDWFRGLAKSGIKATFNGLGKGLLQTPRVDQIPRVTDIWSQSAWVANTCFVLLVMAGGLLVMGHETVQTSYTVKDVAPRLVLGMVAANVSRDLVGRAIELANQLARSLVGPGVDADLAMKTLGQRFSTNVDAGSIFVVLLILVALVLAVVLSIVFAFRVTLTIVLVAAAPLMLACHALPQTEELAKLWWRAVTGVLAIQVAQALVFVIAIRVLFTPDPGLGFTDDSQMWDLLIVVCLMYVLVRIPSWIALQIWTGGLRRSPVARITRYAVYRHLVSSSVRRNSRRGR